MTEHFKNRYIDKKESEMIIMPLSESTVSEFQMLLIWSFKQLTTFVQTSFLIQWQD